MEDPDDYESSVRPPEPVDENGKLVTYDLLRIDNQDGKDMRSGFTMKNKIYVFVNFEISGGEFDGRRFSDILGTQVMPFRKASGADDFFHACSARLDPWPSTNRTYYNAIGEVYGPLKATIDWQLFCKLEPKVDKQGNPIDTDKTGMVMYKTYNAFPLAADGHTRKHEVDCPNCGEFLVAQAKIRRFIIPRD